MSIINTFLNCHSNGRLRKATCEYWDEHIRDRGNIVVCLHKDDEIVSVSAAAIIDKAMHYSCTVTHREHRNQGYGTLAQHIKLLIARERGIEPRCIVAEDNLPSVQIAVKNGMTVLERVELQRERGPYTAITFALP